MATVYSTKDGDMLDWICWRHYGQHARLSEATRQIEPHLVAANGGIDEEVEMLSQFSSTDLRGIVEQVLDANPRLVDYGSRLPAGVDVTLPELEASVEQQDVVQLWD
ncbi:tail protein X [Teredinibacter purpureus]|uniref:tail protein X n=1 Tax=Teredinibacter purpureus TaxID=2731756 RepID=UPI0005F7B56E|nr:tail protein X [Teredinibacter purpureus]